MIENKSPLNCNKCLISLLIILIGITAYCSELFYREFIHHNYQFRSKIRSFFGTVYFTGIITPGDAAQLQSLLNRSFISPVNIIIDSGGGDIYEAMKIGLIIKSNKLDLAVKYHCLSACANYIFPAAHKKIIFETSVLGWHGSVGSNNDWFLQPTLDVSLADGQLNESKVTYTLSSLPEDWKNRVDLIGHEKFQELEKNYFSYINTSELLPICGQIQNVQKVDLKSLTSPTGVSDSFLQSMKWHYFHYSISDLRKFGIKNIVLEGEESKWIENQENSSSILAAFCQTK